MEMVTSTLDTVVVCKLFSNILLVLAVRKNLGFFHPSNMSLMDNRSRSSAVSRLTEMAFCFIFGVNCSTFTVGFGWEGNNEVRNLLICAATISLS